MTVDWSPFLSTDAMAQGPACPSSNASPSTENFSYSDTSFSEAFDKAYLADSFTMNPDYSLDEWVVPDFFDRMATTIETPIGFARRPQAVLNSTLPAVTAQPTVSPWQDKLGQLNGLDTEVFQPTSLPFGTLNTNAFSPSRDASPTPSLCGDGSQASFELATTSPTSPPTSPPTLTSLKRESISEDTEEPEPKRVARKRGRPRINRVESDPTNDTSYADSQKYRSSRRLPHNQVERKYREGLNSELERLRRAVPTLPQRDSSDLTGPPKPSKATVLASAIDYIKFMEAEHERLAEENERLRGICPAQTNPNRARTKLQNVGWNKGRTTTIPAALQ